MEARMRNSIIGSAAAVIGIGTLCITLTMGVADDMRSRAIAEMDAAANDDAVMSQEASYGDDRIHQDSTVTSAPAMDAGSGEAVPGTDGRGDGSGSGSAEQPAPTAGADAYHVEWGDTLSSISDETGRSVDSIAELNGIVDVDLIYADSALQIPA